MLQIKIALTSPVLEMAELFLFIVVEIKLRKQCPLNIMFILLPFSQIIVGAL